MISLPKSKFSSLKRLQVLLLGSYGCGKTTLINSFVSPSSSSSSDNNNNNTDIKSKENNNKEQEEPLHNDGCVLYTKEFTPSSTVGKGKGQRSSMFIWDCPGLLRLRPLVMQVYDGTKGAILCYDSTDAESFKELVYWYNEILRVAPEAVVILVGLKSDLINESIVSNSDGQRQAKEWGCPFVSVSSINGNGVIELFDMLHTLMKKT